MKLSPTAKTLMLATGTVAVAAGFVLVGNHEQRWAGQAEAVAASEHRHNHEGLTWPPQPRGGTTTIIHSNPQKEDHDRSVRQARWDRLEHTSKSDMRTIHGLGNRFTRVAVIDKDDKDDTDEKHTPTVVSQLVYFSHDNNATVEVGFDAEEKIATVTSTPARDYQPEITDEEVVEAEQVARKYFLGQGLKKINGLKAFGILAYKPAGKGFYDSRVIYISFHEHADAPPQLTAWVDLTNKRILEVREELQ